MMVVKARRSGTVDRWIARASVAVVCGSALVVAVTLVSLARVQRQGDVTGYRVGELVDLPSDWFRAGGQTLVVFLRGDCPASQALAAALPGLRRRLPAGVEVLAVVSDTFLPERELAFAQAAGLEPRSIRMAPLHRLKLRLVPAMVLVDRHGRVTMARLGTGRDADETGVLAEVSSLVSGS
jgi:hypothetical protein